MTQLRNDACWLRWSLALATLCLMASLPVSWAGYPDSADILDVSGRWHGAQAEVVWTTGNEVGTAGYRIFRVEAGGDVPLHEGYLPVDITRPGGGIYVVGDPLGTVNASGTYRVEELRGDGSRLTLGRWTVRFGVVSAAPPVLAAPVAVAAAGGVEGPLTPLSPLTNGPAVKVLIETNDVYAVTFAAIASGLGLATGEVAELAGQAGLAMRCGEAPVAYLVDPGQQRLIFYGCGLTNRYTRRNAYWIEPGAGLPMRRINPEPIAVVSNQTFFGVRDYELNLVSMVDHGPDLRDDLYFWTHLVAGNATTGERTLSVPVGGYASGDVLITVRLVGWNDTPSNPDHLVEVRFNDQGLGSFSFDGKVDASATFTAPAAFVLASGNELKIKAILQAGVTSSTILIDGFDVAFTQYYEPLNGLLLATDGGHERLSAGRFSNPLVLDVTDPLVPVWIADASGGVPADVSWPGGGARWALRERSAISEVVPVPGGFGGWMWQATNTVDYLVVAPRVFAAPAQALADYRSGLGLRSAVAIYEDVCDQFAGGLNTPEAVRSLLIHAHQQWRAAPWMVVLGGWGHYDYFGSLTTATNHLPALLGTDSATLRPVDGLCGDVVGDDGVPDLAIGRLPVQSVAQFDDYIAKLQAYETAGPQAWHQRAFFAADNADSGGNFTASNLDMASETQKRYTVEAVSLDSSSAANVRSALRAAFTNGSGIIHYTGHGSYRQLAGENLLDYAGASNLTNAPVPVFLSLTCLIGRFDNHLSVQRCLAEALVLQPNGGALAVYAPAGLSWNNYAGQFGKEFHRLHAVERANTIGPALQRTRASLGVPSGIPADAIRTYNLLGDPAVKLRGGEGGEGEPPLSVDNVPLWRWERYLFAELADPVYSFRAIQAYFDALKGGLLLSIR